jgi:hypothetical protein
MPSWERHEIEAYGKTSQSGKADSPDLGAGKVPKIAGIKRWCFRLISHLLPRPNVSWQLAGSELHLGDSDDGLQGCELRLTFRHQPNESQSLDRPEKGLQLQRGSLGLGTQTREKPTILGLNTHSLNGSNRTYASPEALFQAIFNKSLLLLVSTL